MNFKVVSSSPDSGAFAHYIRSFGNNEVPVTFKLLLSADKRFLGAPLISVGDWPDEKFTTNDRLLGVQIKPEPKGSSVPPISPAVVFRPIDGLLLKHPRCAQNVGNRIQTVAAGFQRELSLNLADFSEL